MDIYSYNLVFVLSNIELLDLLMLYIYILYVYYTKLVATNALSVISERHYGEQTPGCLGLAENVAPSDLLVNGGRN